MSKAFDTVNRNQLFETFEEILLPDEIHLLHILTNDVKLKVRVGADYGPEFTTSVGIMQGDCLSAVLFILYLAKELGRGKKRNSRGGCKLLRSGTNEQEWNGVKIVGLLSKELKEHLISVSKESDPVMTIELGLEEMVVNITCACAPQVGCIENEKEAFW